MKFYAIYSNTGALAAISMLPDCPPSWHAVAMDLDIPMTLPAPIEGEAEQVKEATDIMGTLL